MNRIVNTGLLFHPLNWLTLMVWLVFLGLMIHIFDPHLQPAYANNAKVTK